METEKVTSEAVQKWNICLVKVVLAGLWNKLKLKYLYNSLMACSGYRFKPKAPIACNSNMLNYFGSTEEKCSC